LPKMYGFMYADRTTRMNSFAGLYSDTALPGQRTNCPENV
jgi:hypothetical protein